MFLNRALGSAVSVSLTSGGVNIADSVGVNSADVFKFNLTQRSSVNLLVSGMSGDVNIAIVQDQQATGVAGFGVVNKGEVLGSSALVGMAAEGVQLYGLAPGSYYVIVAGAQSANYSLNMAIGWRIFCGETRRLGKCGLI